MRTLDPQGATVRPPPGVNPPLSLTKNWRRLAHRLAATLAHEQTMGLDVPPEVLALVAELDALAGES